MIAQPARNLRSTWAYGLALLAYWAVRLHRLAAYPVFDDEAGHIRQAKMVWKLLPFSGADDGRVLNILLYAPFWPFGPGALWVSRAATLLVAAVGFAALVALGRRLFGWRAGLWAGVVFILLPFAFFFERIALADTLGLPLVALLAWASVKAGGGGVAGRRPGWAVWIAGAALAGATLAKVNNLLFAFVPVLALAWCAGSLAWAARLRRLLGLYAVAAGVLAPIVGFLVLRAHSTLGLANVAARTTPMPLLERLASQMGTLSGYVGPYLTWPIAGLALIGLAFKWRNRGAWYVAALAAVPLAFFVFGANSLESRYILPVLPAVALLTGVAVPALAARLPGMQPGPAAMLIGFVAAALGPAQFILTGWNMPERLALPANDQPDYIEDWPSGFGVAEAGQLLLERAEREPLTVIVTEGWHLAGLTVHYGWEENLHGVYAFDETRLRLAWLQQGCDPWELVEDRPGATLYVTQRNRYAETTDCLEAEKTLLASFPRPGGQDALDVYELRRPPE